jgi:hypothetical protein
VRFPVLARLGVAAVAMSLLTATTAPATAAAADPSARSGASAPRPPATPPVTRAARAQLAERALADVRSAFSGYPDARPGAAPSGGDVTLALRDLRLRLDDLPAAERKVARRYLARPTGKGDPFVTYAPKANVTNDCVQQPSRGSHFCVYWARATSDAPPPSRNKDGRPDPVPAEVRLTRDVLNHVWDRIVTRGGYKQPPKDTKGPNDKLDVYLADIGDLGLYGYCVPETRQGNTKAYSGYCVLDNDYAHRQFPFHTSTQNLEVTAAHEFFHAVQFAYDASEDPWFMEGTATWMEDEVYDAVNDNVTYLRASSLRHPAHPLDSARGLSVYGNWIWWRYLTEVRFPRRDGGLPLLVRGVWERADESGNGGAHRFRTRQYSMRALAAALRARGTDLAAEVSRFGVAGRHPRLAFSEGRRYPQAGLASTRWLRPGAARVAGAVRLPHLSNGTVAFRAARATGSRTLVIRVDAPSRLRSPVLRVSRVTSAGPQPSKRVRLRRDGGGTVRVRGFGGRHVRSVELTFTNGGSRYRCNAGTLWSCRGRPLDDGLTFRYQALARR